jgi:DNA-binding MarR family transcriptional regulator
MGRFMSQETRAETDRFAEIVRQGIRLKHRFRAVVPEHLAQARARIRELLPEGSTESDADFDHYYELGVILSEAMTPMTMGELSQAVDVPLSTATRIVDSLVDRGYAERLSDPTDRRVVRVGLTQTGQDLYQAIEGMIRMRIGVLLRQFTPDERKTLLRLMHKILDALADELAQTEATGQYPQSGSPDA